MATKPPTRIYMWIYKSDPWLIENIQKNTEKYGKNMQTYGSMKFRAMNWVCEPEFSI